MRVKAITNSSDGNSERKFYFNQFHGPRGIGLLYVREDLSLRPLIFGGAQERNLRAGTENIAAIVGGVRLEFAAFSNDNMKKIHKLVRGIEVE